MHMQRGFRRVAAAAIVAATSWSLGVVTPAHAVTVPAYAAWSFTGSAGAYSGTMTLGPGFPAATFTSNSTSGSGTGLQTGASAWLPAGSPFGAVFGSSQNQPYVNLRPAANNALSPSVTIYTFADPIPAGSWAFALGDIDADLAQVSATDADGNPVAVADLGFQGAFNYCDASPASCSGPPFDLPTWNPATATLTGNGVDTSGASGWFRPTVALSTLTVAFTFASGQPIYQTWFASLTRSVTGTVTHDGAGRGGVDLTLTGPDGTALATTTTAADGTYHFDGYGAVPGYTVAMTTPAGLEPVGPTSQTADLTTADAVADFALATPAPPTTTAPPTTPAPVTYPVTGVVTDASNAPVTGAQVTLSDAAGTAIGATSTNDAGRYTFPAVPAGNFRLNIAATGTFQGAAIDIQVPLATGEVAPIVLAAQPPLPPTVAPELPATGRRGTAATSSAALFFVALGTALALGSRRRARP